MQFLLAMMESVKHPDFCFREDSRGRQDLEGLLLLPTGCILMKQNLILVVKLFALSRAHPDEENLLSTAKCCR